MTRVAAGLSTRADAGGAAVEAAAAAGAGAADLVGLFLSPEHLDDVEEAVAAVQETLRPGTLVGCVAEGIVGGDRELEQGPAVAVWAAALPGAEVRGFHASAVELDDAIAITGFPELGEPDLVTLLIDPFTFPAAPFLERLNEESPGLPVVGGIASGGGSPGTAALILDGAVHPEGAVGAVVSGAPVVTVVSQGCAPVGRDLVITAADGNVVQELAGEPALEQLRRELGSLPPERQRLAMAGILAGLVIDENRPEYERGDFLVRGVLAADEESGSITIGEPVRVGQTLRFHVRDADSADEDLRQALAGALRRGTPAGALLFTCNGRGTHMFPHADHDARLVTSALGSRGVAGFFCGGEIGPVGPRAFLHGFTATLAVFLEA